MVLFRAAARSKLTQTPYPEVFVALQFARPHINLNLAILYKPSPNQFRDSLILLPSTRPVCGLFVPDQAGSLVGKCSGKDFTLVFDLLITSFLSCFDSFDNIALFIHLCFLQRYSLINCQEMNSFSRGYSTSFERSAYPYSN